DERGTSPVACRSASGGRRRRACAGVIEPEEARPADDPPARLHLSQRSTIGRMDEFVPRDFDVPRRLETPQFVLEPLGPEHNDQDYDRSEERRVGKEWRSRWSQDR